MCGCFVSPSLRGEVEGAVITPHGFAHLHTMTRASPTPTVVGAVVAIAVVVAAAVCGVALPVSPPPPASPQPPATLLYVPEPEWRRPIESSGHHPTSQWLFPVRRGRILYQPPLQLAPGLCTVGHEVAVYKMTVAGVWWRRAATGGSVQVRANRTRRGGGGRGSATNSVVGEAPTAAFTDVC